MCQYTSGVLRSYWYCWWFAFGCFSHRTVTKISGAEMCYVARADALSAAEEVWRNMSVWRIQRTTILVWQSATAIAVSGDGPMRRRSLLLGLRLDLVVVRAWTRRWAWHSRNLLSNRIAPWSMRSVRKGQDWGTGEQSCVSSSGNSEDPRLLTSLEEAVL